MSKSPFTPFSRLIAASGLALLLASCGERQQAAAPPPPSVTVAHPTLRTVTDMDEYFKHQDVRMKFFEHALPTSTTVQVSRLSRPEFMVEIEAFAIV